MHCCDAVQGLQASQERILVALQLILEVVGQRHVAQSRDENALRSSAGICGNGIRQLVDVTKQTGLKQQLLHGVSVHLAGIVLTEVSIVQLVVGFYADAQDASTLSAQD